MTYKSVKVNDLVRLGNVDLKLFNLQRGTLRRMIEDMVADGRDSDALELTGLENLLDHIYDQLVPPEGDKCPVCSELGYTDPNECTFCADNKAVPQ